MGLYSDEWWYANGQLATNQRAAVFEDDDNTLAAIFSDPAMTVPLANPTTTDSNGILTFYAADGQYWIFVGPVGTGDSVLTTVGAGPPAPVTSVNGEGPDMFGNVTIDADDVGAIPKAIMDAKGDIISATAADTPVRVGIGPDGYVLTADSTQATGLKWEVAPGAIPDTILDFKGDMIAAIANDSPVRVPVGTDGQVLMASSSEAAGVEWDTLDAADIDGVVPETRTINTINGLTGGGDLSADRTFEPVYGTTAATVAEGNDPRIVNAQQRTVIDALGDLYVGTADNTTTRLPAGADGEILSSNSSEPTGLEWIPAPSAPVTSVNSQTGAVVLTSADVGAQPIATIDAKGDLYAGTADNATTRLPVGTDGEILSANSAQPTGLEWIPAPSAPVTSVNSQTGAVVLTSADVGAQPIATINAKGDIYAGTADNATTNLPVGTDGQILSANSATGTGLQWIPAPSAPVTSVNGETGAVILDAADVDAAPETRTLTAGIGLSGGGDLTADRTFDVDYGTTAGTAAEGNDTRIVNAVQRTLLDAKGDIIAATAADTETRLPVGTDGQVLRANSATGTGLEWDTLTAADVGAVAAGDAQLLATIDAKGDLYAGTADNTTTRLPVGTDGQVLSANSAQATGLEWISAPGGGISPTIFDAKGDLLTATAADTPVILPVGTNNQILVPNSAVANGIEWVDNDLYTEESITITAAGSTMISPTSARNRIVHTSVTATAAWAGTHVLILDDTFAQVGDARTFAFSVGASAGTIEVRSGSVGGTLLYTVPTGTGAYQGVSYRWMTGTVWGALNLLRTTTLSLLDTAQQRTTINAKGDLYAGTANDTTTRLAVGTNGQVLTANSAQATGLEWTTPTLPNLVDAKGDVVTATADNTPARLAVGTNGQILSANSAQATGLEWIAAPATGIPASIVDVKGDIIAATAADTVARLAAGSNGQVLTANSAQATGLEWTTISSGIPASIVDAKGDLIVATAADTVARQAVGSNGQNLIADSTQTNGVRWGAPLFTMVNSSTQICLSAIFETSRASAAATLDRLYYMPFAFTFAGSFRNIFVEVTASTATASCRVGVYDSNSNLRPNNLLSDFGTFAIATISTGVNMDIADTAFEAHKLYWIAFVNQTVATSIRFISGISPYVQQSAAPSGATQSYAPAFYHSSSVSGALPASATVAGSRSNAPLLWINA